MSGYCKIQYFIQNKNEEVFNITISAYIDSACDMLTDYIGQKALKYQKINCANLKTKNMLQQSV
mgnify:CR=1 FL=1